MPVKQLIRSPRQTLVQPFLWPATTSLSVMSWQPCVDIFPGKDVTQNPNQTWAILVPYSTLETTILDTILLRWFLVLDNLFFLLCFMRFLFSKYDIHQDVSHFFLWLLQTFMLVCIHMYTQRDTTIQSWYRLASNMQIHYGVLLHMKTFSKDKCKWSMVYNHTFKASSS